MQRSALCGKNTEKGRITSPYLRTSDSRPLHFFPASVQTLGDHPSASWRTRPCQPFVTFRLAFLKPSGPHPFPPRVLLNALRALCEHTRSSALPHLPAPPLRRPIWSLRLSPPLRPRHRRSALTLTTAHSSLSRFLDTVGMVSSTVLSTHSRQIRRRTPSSAFPTRTSAPPHASANFTCARSPSTSSHRATRTW